ncbi:hypothetical protein [Flavobacterium eburneipallidum]|uniref:hypothetical protein n=1 Tax=Flavobacterium eburneipallidum TaxID=3003263 RepID=UPI0022AC82CF|nr:hypothetical protein [Flavobacterium eburneipallidum]
MGNSNFQKHPSKALINLYNLRNFQGANPIDAKVLFVGKDPNWAINIEELSIFELVKEYLTDGVKFWKKYNIHHPFLHPKYDGEGKKYHTAISKLNLESNLANKISFIEIVGFPTTGMSSINNKQFNEYLLSQENRKHLIELDKLLNNPEKLIFLFWGILNYLKYLNKKTGLFKKFSNIDKQSMNRTDLNKRGNIYFHKHFSMGISQETLRKISSEIRIELN